MSFAEWISGIDPVVFYAVGVFLAAVVFVAVIDWLRHICFKGCRKKYDKKVPAVVKSIWDATVNIGFEKKYLVIVSYTYDGVEYNSALRDYLTAAEYGSGDLEIWIMSSNPKKCCYRKQVEEWI